MTDYEKMGVSVCRIETMRIPAYHVRQNGVYLGRMIESVFKARGLEWFVVIREPVRNGKSDHLDTPPCEFLRYCDTVEDAVHDIVVATDFYRDHGRLPR